MIVYKHTKIDFFNGVNDAHIYTGSFRNLKKVNVKPHDDYAEIDGIKTGDNFPYLTLDEIRQQVNKDGSTRMITVFQEDPMHSEIYQYGNYGDSWVHLGTILGYA